MELVIERQTLADALQIVGPLAAGKSSLPVLACVKIEATADGAQLSTTDHSAYSSVPVAADVRDPGGVCVPVRLLSDLVRGSKADALKLSTTARQPTALRVEGDGATANIRGFDAESFPIFAKPDDAVVLQIDGSDFARGVNSVAYAVAADPSRPVISSVNLKTVGGTAIFAGTDGYRLAEMQLRIDDADSAVDANIPPHVLRQVASLADGETLEIGISGYERAWFEARGKFAFITSLAAGRYPDYKAIIPKSHSTAVEVNRGDFVHALRQSLPFVGAANLVELSITDAQIQVRSAGGSDVGDFCKELPADVTGPALDIKFNAKYLIDAASALTGDIVKLELTQPTRPMVMRGDTDSVMSISMPMHPSR